MSRRGFMRTTAAVGVGVVALSSGSAAGTATGPGTRSSYTILEGTANEQQVHVYDAPASGPTTVVVGGVHGDEAAGYQAADRIAEWAVERGKLVVVPRANPAAIENDERPWGTGDLDRQFPSDGGDCLSTHSRAIWAELERHDPDLVFDLHTSRGIYESGDGGVGQAMFPTPSARSHGEQTVSALNDQFDLSGGMRYRPGSTLDADRDMLMHRVSGVLDCPGYICETTRKADISEQVAWHLYTVEHAMAQFGHVRGTPTPDSTESPSQSPSPTSDSPPRDDAPNATPDDRSPEDRPVDTPATSPTDPGLEQRDDDVLTPSPPGPLDSLTDLVGDLVAFPVNLLGRALSW